ncbi:hypothetical protein ACHAXT_006790 [Thalassiosira profunda]
MPPPSSSSLVVLSVEEDRALYLAQIFALTNPQTSPLHASSILRSSPTQRIPAPPASASSQSIDLRRPAPPAPVITAATPRGQPTLLHLSPSHLQPLVHLRPLQPIATMSSAEEYYRSDPALNAYLASMASPGGYASPAGHAGFAGQGQQGDLLVGTAVSHEEEEVDEQVAEEVVPVANGGRKKKRKAKAKRDPNKPKGWLNPHMLYANANRARAKAENPGMSFGDLARLMSAEYKALSTEDMAAWKQASADDKKRFELEMLTYVPPVSGQSDGSEVGGAEEEGVVVEAPKKKRKEKDPNAPKRNRTAWNYFLSGDARRLVREEQPDASLGEMTKALGMRFKALTPEEKAPFDELAAADKQRYEREMAAYTGGVENV